MTVRCEIIVIEDIDRDPVGTKGEFLTVPRVGEFVANFGRVESVTHLPMLPDDDASLPYASATLFVRREAKDA